MTNDRQNDPSAEGGGASPFKAAALTERCMGDASLAALLLQKFEKQLESDLRDITRLLADGDAAQLARTAHALKGAAGTVAADALFGLAADLEQAARKDQLDAVTAQVARLQAEAERCLNHLPVVRRALGSAASGGAAAAESAP